MKKIYQYRNVKHLKYMPSSGNLTMNIVGSDDDYVTQVNNVEMDVLKFNFSSFFLSIPLSFNSFFPFFSKYIIFYTK